jgi:hypothetical protein
MTPELLIDPVSHRLLVDREPLARATFRALVEVDPAHVAPWARIEDHKVDPWSLSRRSGSTHARGTWCAPPWRSRVWGTTSLW